MEAAQDRPPYVLFETRAVEDRAASMVEGHYRTKDVDFAIVTPQGSKDRVERNVAEWFEQLTQQVQEQRFKPEWLRAFKESYAAWKEGREIPLTGTSIMYWPVVSPSQVKQLLDFRIRTVEDLAEANEESIARLGMGGRHLKDKAINWLKAASGNGRVVEELSALRVELDAAKLRNDLLEKQVKELAAKLPSSATR